MLISYRNKDIQKICENQNFATRSLQKASAVGKLFLRMNALADFETLGDVPTISPFFRHKLKGKAKDLWAIRIDGANRICFRPVGEYEISSENEIDLSTVTSVEINFIGDYHG
ncbi:MAG: hypothetical protein HN757_06500 [Calditrichaeota bacterium]|jgi:plasmid maintenance system killer protein|nr:hypothetical protein [Calditrichota bacterium]